jgi:hypothetical protein
MRAEIAALFANGAPACDGYFVPGLYVMNGKILRHGLRNAKLALFDRRKFRFPVIDDLDIPGMGELEGHYQPVAKQPGVTIGHVKSALLHHAYDGDWRGRHERYAAWERGMNARDAWPRDPVRWRQTLKIIFRRAPCRPAIAFAHSYILKAGFLDGRAGFELARDRWRYYAMIGSGGAPDDRFPEFGDAVNKD